MKMEVPFQARTPFLQSGDNAGMGPGMLNSIINIPVKHNACVLLEDIRNLIEGFPYILKLRIRAHICSSRILPSLFYFSTLIL